MVGTKVADSDSPFGRVAMITVMTMLVVVFEGAVGVAVLDMLPEPDEVVVRVDIAVEMGLEMVVVLLAGSEDVVVLAVVVFAGREVVLINVVVLPWTDVDMEMTVVLLLEVVTAVPVDVLLVIAVTLRP